MSFPDGDLLSAMGVSSCGLRVARACRIAVSAKLETAQFAVVAPPLEHAVELDGSAAIDVREPAAFFRLAFVVVVAGCARGEKLLDHPPLRAHRLEPFLLGFGAWLDTPCRASPCLEDQGHDVTRLLVHHVREVCGEAGL